MSKLPWFKFDRSAWLTDGRLCLCSPTARGIWIDLICRMDEEDRCGEITGTPAELAKHCRCTATVMKRTIKELEHTGTADIEELDGVYRIVSRRMRREYQKLHGAAIRQRRFRENGGGDPARWVATRVHILERDGYKCAYCGKQAKTVDHIIPRSHGGDESPTNLVACCTSCNSAKCDRGLEESGMQIQEHNVLCNAVNNATNNPLSYICHLTSKLSTLFEQFWTNYPRKVGKLKCVEWFAKHEPDAELVAIMVAALDRQRQWPQWQKDGGQFIPHPATWLNQGRWADEGMDTMQAAKQKSAAELMAEYEAKDEKRRSTEIH